MLEKLISIQNVGKFTKLNLRDGDWDGEFSKNNIIYAPNGSGKTTFSLILQSIKGKSELLGKKMTFKDNQLKGQSEQKVSIKVSGKPIFFKDGKWTDSVNDIEVFNIHYIEDNLFVGSRQLKHNQINLFSELSGSIGAKMNEERVSITNQLNILSAEHKKFTQKMRGKGITVPMKQAKMAEFEARKTPLSKRLHEIDKEMGLFAQEIFEVFTKRTNDFLKNFSRTMILEKISKERDQLTTFYLKFGSNRVTFESKPDSHEFRYTLSEGDKNALAFSIFLAKLSFIPNLKDWIVVFDDPLTSLDSGRRLLTIKELSRLSERVGQLIVLTHDASFAADLEREIRCNCLSLELTASQYGCSIQKRVHQSQNVTGLFRDIATLTQFKKNGAQNDSDRRDVIRCLRPVLEGFIRVKYFELLSNNQWLGDFIKAIRESKEGGELFRLKESAIFDALTDINDYSKSFHHSSPSTPDIAPNEEELEIMVDKTLSLIKAI